MNHTFDLTTNEVVFLTDILDKMIKVEDANVRGCYTSRMLNRAGAKKAEGKLVHLRSIRAKVAP